MNWFGPEGKYIYLMFAHFGWRYRNIDCFSFLSFLSLDAATGSCKCVTDSRTMNSKYV